MPARRPVGSADALARVVLNRYLGVRRGEPVTVESWSHALPWARALVVEARRQGARPVLVVEDEDAYFRSLATAGAGGTVRRGSGWTPRGGAHVYLGGPEEFDRLLGLPAADRARLLDRHDRTWWAEARRTRTRAVRLAVVDATPSAAARFEVDREAWQSELLRGSLVDPARLDRAATRVVAALGRARRLRIRHPNGTDLTVERAGRTPFVDLGRPDPAAGIVWSRVPAGLVVLPLRSGATRGTWESNRSTYDRFVRAPVTSGSRFSFRDGRLVDAEFERGGEPFDTVVSRVGRDRPRAVAVTVGVNPAVNAAPEVESLPEGTLGLLIADAPYRPGGAGPAFSFLATLAHAEVDADGRSWLRAGRPAEDRAA